MSPRSHLVMTFFINPFLFLYLIIAFLFQLSQASVHQTWLGETHHLLHLVRDKTPIGADHGWRKQALDVRALQTSMWKLFVLVVKVSLDVQKKQADASPVGKVFAWALDNKNKEDVAGQATRSSWGHEVTLTHHARKDFWQWKSPNLSTEKSQI